MLLCRYNALTAAYRAIETAHVCPAGFTVSVQYIASTNNTNTTTPSTDSSAMTPRDLGPLITPVLRPSVGHSNSSSSNVTFAHTSNATYANLAEVPGDSSTEVSFIVVNYTTPIVFGIDPDVGDLCVNGPVSNAAFYSDQYSNDGNLVFDSSDNWASNPGMFHNVTATLNSDNSLSMLNVDTGASFLMNCNGALSLKFSDEMVGGCVPVKLWAAPVVGAVVATKVVTTTTTTTTTVVAPQTATGTTATRTDMVTTTTDPPATTSV